MSTADVQAAEDEQLLRAAGAGDRAALGQLYDRFAPSLLAVAQRIVGSPREAEDVVHDVFLEAWHRARHYDPQRGTVRTWLMLRLRSRSLDRLRAARRAHAVSLEDSSMAQPTEGRASDTAVRAIDGKALSRAVLDLPPDQRAVLELGYFAGQSCAEIATALCVPIGTVKSRMSRAIAHLRRQLGEHEVGAS